jgi:spore coat polysaccharide biosynthesis protein SpsF
MRTVAIVQARMGSSRLPGKALAPIAGRAMINRVIERVRAAKLIDEVVVATTTLSEDDRLVDALELGRQCGIFRGDAEDVLARYFGCALQFAATVIVRVTADDPLKDPEIIDRSISQLTGDAHLDYCSNTLDATFPEGLDIEAFRFRALQRAHEEATLRSDREHVTPYIWRHPDRFSVANFTSDRNLKHWRWTVDKPDDLAFMNLIFSHFADQPLVSYRDVIAWLQSVPELVHTNASTERNEGYLTSLAADARPRT